MGNVIVNPIDALPEEWRAAIVTEKPNPFLPAQTSTASTTVQLDEDRIEDIVRAGFAHVEKGLHDSLVCVGHHCAGLSEADVRDLVAPRAKQVADAYRGSSAYSVADVARNVLAGWNWASANGIPASLPRKGSRGFELFDFDALAVLPEPAFLIENLIPLGGISAIIGPPGSGKTHLAVAVSVGVALGVPVLTHPVPATASGPVVIAAGEGVNGYQRRIRANLPNGTESPGPLYVIPRAPDLGDDADVESLGDALARLTVPPALLVIDTLSRSIPGLDENSAGDMSAVIRRLDRLRERFSDLSVLLIAHTTKDDRRGTLRGSSALTGALDAIWWLHQASGGLELSCVKAKEFSEPKPLALKIVNAEDNGSARIGLRDNRASVSPDIAAIVQFTRAAIRDNEGTIPNIAATAELPVETARGHLKRAESLGLLESKQDAHRKGKPWIYALTERGEGLSRDVTD